MPLFQGMAISVLRLGHGYSSVCFSIVLYIYTFLRICTKYYIKKLKTESRKNQEKGTSNRRGTMRSQAPTQESNFSLAALREVTGRTKENLKMVVTEKLRGVICLFFPFKK